MQVVDEFGHTGINIDQAIGKFDRMRCGVTNTPDTADRRDVLNQVGQVGSTVFISGAAVGVNVLAEQGDFPDALCGKLGRLGQDIVQRPGDFLPARVRHYAESTVFAAPFHDGNKGKRTVCPGFGQAVEFFNFREGYIDCRFACSARLVIKSGNPVQGLRAEYDVHERRPRMNRRAFLAGDTTPYTYHEIRLFLFTVTPAAQFREQFFLGFFANGTGIEDDEIGLFRHRCLLHSMGSVQYVPHLRGVVFIHLAAECLDKKFFSHVPFNLQGSATLHLLFCFFQHYVD